MEARLEEPLDIQALAAEAHLSPYYFQRLFSRLVGRIRAALTARTEKKHASQASLAGGFGHTRAGWQKKHENVLTLT
ncbi:MAG TPA: hypothetical protein PKE04_15010 [Clostridia bacterium]|nr:hypothetical protein [Clostridia bacterium]